MFFKNVIDKITSLEKTITLISNRLDQVSKILDTTARISDLIKSESSTKETIKSISEVISKIEKKLATIVLPEDTKFFLDKDEVQNFRNNIQQLTAMMAAMEQLYKNLVAYTANKK